MNIKDKIKLYEENISKKENIGYKKSQINKNNVRRKINHWNTINNDIIKKEKIKEKKNLKKEDSEDEYEFENCIINM